MKKIITCLFLALVALSACDDKLDITPKGKSTLASTDDLELLLNNSLTVSDFGTTIQPLLVVCNESYTYNNVNTVLSQPNTVDYAWLTGDENVDRASLTATNTWYDNAYKWINYFNIVIEKAPSSEGGSEAKKQQLVAEAHVLRAYFHFLLVNIFAKQYDEATAADEGGIPYVTNSDPSEVKQKVTVKEVYDNILTDCSDEYISQLPDKGSVIRAGKAFGNAVRGRVLLQMKRYADAAPYFEKALTYNNTIYDYRPVITDEEWTMTDKDEHNIFYINGGFSIPFGEVLSLETSAKFEKGDIILNYAKSYGSPVWNSTRGVSRSGVIGSYYCGDFMLDYNNWGFTVERVYYCLAECNIRTGNISKGMDEINTVRVNRIDPAVYEPLTATTEADAMQKLEDCKWIECLATYENFFDCKRHNTEEAYRKTITRTMPTAAGTYNYSIAPDSKLWVFPFPLSGIKHNPTLTQNY